jgi:hypothetical protein
VLVALGWMACSDPVDKAAKARIFSPEDPPKVVATAAEKLSVANMPSDPQVSRRVLQMSAAELTERLGSHQMKSSLGFEWSAKEGKQVKLTEVRTVVAGAGGVNGDFHATLENSRDQGLEVIRTQGQVFARSRYGKFRQRLRDRGMSERERDEMSGALRDFYSLFDGKLAFSDQGSTQLEGRETRKFTVSLASKGVEEVERKDLPDLVKAKNGVDPTTRRRLAFFEGRLAKSIDGALWVDEDTGVVLKAQLSGRLNAVGPQGTGEDAQLRVTLDHALSQVGKPVALKPPPDFLPDQDKPSGIADALDRFGVPRGGGVKDAGTSAPPKDPEEDE